MIALGIVALLVVVVLWDNLANLGKAYGNVSINGESVAGMSEEQMRSMLENEYGVALATGDVRIYASESTRGHENSELSRQADAATAEQVSADEAKKNVKSWVTSANGVRAHIPYDDLVARALAAGREGGPLERL